MPFRSTYFIEESVESKSRRVGLTRLSVTSARTVEWVFRRRFLREIAAFVGVVNIASPDVLVSDLLCEFLDLFSFSLKEFSTMVKTLSSVFFFCYYTFVSGCALYLEL